MTTQTVTDRVRQTGAWASLTPQDVEELIATIESGDVIAATEGIMTEVEIHQMCGNYTKGDVLLALADEVWKLRGR